MRKRLLIISSIVLFTATIQLQAAPMAMSMEMGVAEQVDPDKNITISVDGNTVQVKGATDLVLEVVSLTGRQVATYRINGPAERLELNIPKGCYILKVGKVVRKVTIR